MEKIKVSAWLLLIAIIGMKLSMVYLSVQITHWYNDFYTLIAGVSGCGKSTLLRLLAGIWPYGEGELQKLEENLIVRRTAKTSVFRIFLMKPDIIFLDESTSSLDEENEENAYRYLKERLGDAVIISVGHRKRLVEFHDRKITLKKGGIVEINK